MLTELVLADLERQVAQGDDLLAVVAEEDAADLLEGDRGGRRHEPTNFVLMTASGSTLSGA